MSQCGTLADPVFLPLTVPDLKRPQGSQKYKNCNGACTGHFMCLEKVLATDNSYLLTAHSYPLSTTIKKSFEKAPKESRDLNSEDVQELPEASPSEY